MYEYGANVRGFDLSPELIAQARRLHPEVSFEIGDMLALPMADESVRGIVAFYAIVHFDESQLKQVFQEFFRVLEAGGILLISFHIGDGIKRVEEFLGRPMVLDFSFFQPQRVAESLRTAGFATVKIHEREPYPEVEFPTRRAYLWARKSD